MTEEQEREIMKAIQEFKSNFPSAKVKKGAEFVFTKNRDGYLEMEFEVFRSVLTSQNPVTIIDTLFPRESKWAP